jgi:hypothetical protein
MENKIVCGFTKINFVFILFYFQLVANIEIFIYFALWHYNFNRCIALKCESCFNTGESAAVFGFPLKKAVKIHPRVETAAAGLLFNFLPQSSQRAQREDRRRKTEDGRQKTDDRRRKTEDRRQKTEDKRQGKEEKWHF